MLCKGNRGASGVTVAIVIACAVIVVLVLIVFAVALPVLSHAKIAAAGSSCMSNMNQLGKAMKCYLTDWEDCYPTNRLNSRGKPMSPEVELSRIDSQTGEPVKPFEHGLNWVESLYPYVAKVGAKEDSVTVWTCPSASSQTFPTNSTSARVTYAMNYCLVEQPEAAIRSSGRTMMLREMDRRFGAVCRPTNIPDDRHHPSGAFLTGSDPVAGVVKPSLHMDGSNLLFADGHVRRLSSAMMPADSGLHCDSDGRWLTTSDPQDPQCIAISP